MGERSQIFIRYRVKPTKRSVKYETEGFIAVHHQWSYGERMISRCRGIIEHLAYMGEYTFKFADDASLDILRQTVDTNFDMRSIVKGVDLVKEAIQYGEADKMNVFCTDSNHGHIYIDITAFGDGTAPVISYAFCDYYDKPVMDVLQFADHDIGNIGQELDPEEPRRQWFQPGRYQMESAEGMERFAEMLKYTGDNIKYIQANARLMTEPERDQFVQWGNEYVNRQAAGK